MNSLTPDDKDWIRAHIESTPAQLYLKHHGDARLTWLSEQVECRRKAFEKLSGWPVSEDFIFPNPLAVEQSTSIAIASIHASLIENGERVLDMTCGLGIDAMHLAKRASCVTAIDIKPENAEAAELNARSANLDNKLQIICGDSVEFLRSTDQKFTTIFIDPSRRDASGKRLVSLNDCLPCVPEFLEVASRKATRMIVKCSPMLDIALMVQTLQPYHVEILIIGTPRECKELVAIVDFTRMATEDFTMRCIIEGMQCLNFSFTRTEESDCSPVLSLPTAGSVLLEPFAPITKSGGFKSFAERFGLKKLSSETHLYHTDALLEKPVPATSWKVEAVIPFNKRNLKEIAARYPSISVATRGFIMDSETLRKRLKVKEGSGNRKLWGVTAPDGSLNLLVGSRL